MKITVYTVSDCKYSKDEKDFLKAHNLPYEEKNLESNREFLTEMLAVSNNFAGTPVTKVEKDDGKIEVLKGFTEDEFNTALGLKADAKLQAGTTEAASTMAMPAMGTMPKPAASTPSVITPPTTEPTSEPATEPQSDELNSILADLKAKSETAAPASTPGTPTPPAPAAPTPTPTAPSEPATPTTPPPAPASTPTTTETPKPEMPAVPDFDKT